MALLPSKYVEITAIITDIVAIALSAYGIPQIGSNPINNALIMVNIFNVYFDIFFIFCKKRDKSTCIPSQKVLL